MTCDEPLAAGPGSLGLFDDPAFQVLLRHFSQKCMSWEEFLSHDMPRGLSPLRTWELLTRMSHFTGIQFPVRDLNDSQYWYHRTHELTDIANIVARACAPDSRLHRTMTSTGGQHFLMNVRIAETIAATRLDGLSISVEDADILLRLDRAPRSATERLVVNTFGAMDNLSDLVQVPFSRDLFWHLRDRLLDGVDTAALAKAQAPLGTGLFEWPDNLVERFADRQLDTLADWANHETGSEYDLDVLRALLITDTFRFYRPLKEVSNQVGRLVSHLYALKHGLPVLGLLPASQVKLDWDEGRIIPPLVSFDRHTFEDLRRRSSGDLTCLQTLLAQLSLIALRTVERYLDEWENRDQELRQMLKKDHGLNDRQRAILGRALRKPEAEFTLRYHKTNHGIAYPTARRDFMKLVDLGYLSLEQQGKRFVFIPTRRLQEMFTAPSLARLRGFAVDLITPELPPNAGPSR
ncbi:MAG: hypothetical protein P4L36_10945 [Holophaga sp.]|nr:hypothetical protein [Holophaga sp.]